MISEWKGILRSGGERGEGKQQVLTLHGLLVEEIVCHFADRRWADGVRDDISPVLEDNAGRELGVRLTELGHIVSDVAAHIDEKHAVRRGVINGDLMGVDVQPAGLMLHDTAHHVVECLALFWMSVIVGEEITFPALGVLEDSSRRVSGCGISVLRQILGHLVETRNQCIVSAPRGRQLLGRSVGGACNRACGSHV